MTLVYSQSTGVLRGEVQADGYSGHGAGKNNPQAEDIHDVGPIPRGLWVIGMALDHPELGPLSIPLNPTSTVDTHGRTGFYIHGDSASHPGEASHGCIILPRTARRAIIEGEFTILEVVA